MVAVEEESYGKLECIHCALGACSPIQNRHVYKTKQQNKNGLVETGFASKPVLIQNGLVKKALVLGGMVC